MGVEVRRNKFNKMGNSLALVINFIMKRRWPTKESGANGNLERF